MLTFSSIAPVIMETVNFKYNYRNTIMPITSCFCYDFNLSFSFDSCSLSLSLLLFFSLVLILVLLVCQFLSICVCSCLSLTHTHMHTWLFMDIFPEDLMTTLISAWNESFLGLVTTNHINLWRFIALWSKSRRLPKILNKQKRWWS